MPFRKSDGDKAVVWSEDNSEAIQVPTGPITKSRAKKLKISLYELIQTIWAQEKGTIKPIEGEKHGAQSEGWITLIKA
ncbi:hypothetical protein LguiA_017654 [Lonicera macranthoides]